MGLMDGFPGGMSSGFMGQLANQLGGGNNRLLGAVARLIGGRDIGGLSGLAQLFAQRGYGDAVNSWISRDQNREITTPQLQEVLGQERIREVASTAGVTETEAADGLADLLPQLVDKMTPEGQLPETSASNGMLSQIADQFLGGIGQPAAPEQPPRR